MEYAAFELAYKIAVLLIFGLFICLTAWSYLRHRLNGKTQARAEYIRDKLGEGANGSLLSQEWASCPKGRDYIVPIASAVLVTVFGAGSCLFANDLLHTAFFLSEGSEIVLPAWHSILLTGLYQESSAEALHERRWQSLTIMSLAFLGAFIWSAHNIIRRYINYDLIPIEYYHTTLRLILAPVLALMLSFFFDEGQLGEGGWPPSLLPVIAFMTGMIPAAVLFFLQDSFIRLLQYSGFYADHLPLSMIEGLNRFHEVRLSEAGIDNAQNLANADLTELALLTPYQPEQLLDWIDQARLYVQLRGDIGVMRQHRARTASDLVNFDPETIKRLQGEDGLADLETVVYLIEKDPRQKRINEWREALALGTHKLGPSAQHYAIAADN
ncbi:MAG: hypothetical protein ACR2QF_00400 [Geminicoccaceae bacterium]